MILGNLNKTEVLTNFHPKFKHVFEFIKNNDLNFYEVSDDKIEIDGDEVFFFVKELSAKEHDESVLEAHNNYIDVHIPLKTFEIFGWAGREDCKNIKTGYNADDDVIFYNDPVSTYFMVSIGDFAVFYPEDVHATGIGYGPIKKAIFKVRI
jgi:YhcH/YjgK/YiaL family protein